MVSNTCAGRPRSVMMTGPLLAARFSRHAPMRTALSATPAAPVANSTPSFALHAFDAALGAEIVGLDVVVLLDNAIVARVYRAHLDHDVVVFRHQPGQAPLAAGLLDGGQRARCGGP